MKFLRFLCNLLLFIAVSFGVSVVQVGLFDLAAAQSPDVTAIHIFSSNDEDVSYLDSYVFYVDDIRANYKQDAKYRVRNWATPDWWKKGMQWADYGIDAVVATTKPIFVPIAQINAILNYYDEIVDTNGDDILDRRNNDYFANYYLKHYEDAEAVNNALYEECVIFEMGYENLYNLPLPMTLGEPVPINEWTYTGKLDAETIMAKADKYADYSRWVKENKAMYNTNWKLVKYNSEIYNKYFVKFITLVGHTRHIKPAAIVLYYQQYVSLIIAFIFVMKFPINFIQYNYEGGEGHRPRRRHRKNKGEQQ